MHLYGLDPSLTSLYEAGANASRLQFVIIWEKGKTDIDINWRWTILTSTNDQKFSNLLFTELYCSLEMKLKQTLPSWQWCST